MKLSILTPSIPSRLSQVGKLAEKFNHPDVEHLIFCDNRKRSIGAKRQALVDIARGQYIAFVDDDDDVTPEYIPQLLKAIEQKPDVITFQQKAIYNGLISTVHFRLKNQDSNFNPGGITERGAWHVCAWRRDLVDGCMFSESNYGEDLVWCNQARLRVSSEIHIPKILHRYTHDAGTTAAPES
jgi:glycosyltransferase involved in cell wall biosynthesis